ncbi:hypothetical protein SKAU_G00381160 [Synaphobranchus kaupii]|uniref:Uncharacterized protein n=1 Tax=Synaphobranchus kaupii TaxID=118154 RepID=A0A9Q1EDQ9_SYNKA|nr:hypothetical protein SKAU_G00381160 [Synaphobranchus kaupii]
MVSSIFIELACSNKSVWRLELLTVYAAITYRASVSELSAGESARQRRKDTQAVRRRSNPQAGPSSLRKASD